MWRSDGWGGVLCLTLGLIWWKLGVEPVMSVEALMVQTCSVERWIRTRDSSSFEFVAGWSSESEAVACNVQEKGANFSATVAGLQVTFDAVGYFPAGTDLRPQSAGGHEGDRITVLETGAVYQVRAVVDQAGRAYFLKAFLKRV